MTYSAIEQAERLQQPARIRSLQLGSTKVSYVPDGAVRLRPRDLLPDTADGTVWADHPEYLDESGSLVASIGGLLVENGDRALLIDAGFGPQSLPPAPSGPRGAIHGGALLDSLAELGREPGQINAVAITHLHPDHTGWAWQPATGADQPAFAHADYLVSEPEWAGRDLLETKEVAGLAPHIRTVTDGQEIFPGVRMRMTAGHSPGHAAYVITAGEQRLIAFGDALHSPIQVDHPEWSTTFDHDPVQAAVHRRQLLDELAEPHTIGFGIHFADVVFGQVKRDGDGPAWRPLDV
ncbi:MBL fold metallo-hydrolase [Streptomyces sp. NPDC050439]|uniref:MBL fold metallo-hydrolase n=1 Tax=unclassified Streptomyces TaxID=2593676 RepID=UPI0034458FEC